MSAPIDPQRLAIAREYARARRSDRLAATLTDLLSEVLADRDQLAAEADKLRNELSCERGDCERAMAIVDSVKAELGDHDLEGEDIWAAVQELRERAEAGS